jgi:hypothetical protein
LPRSTVSVLLPFRLRITSSRVAVGGGAAALEATMPVLPEGELLLYRLNPRVAPTIKTVQVVGSYGSAMAVLVSDETVPVVSSR